MDGSREGVLNLFKGYMHETSSTEALKSLVGKTLGCHCGPGQACHADLLIEAAEAAEDARSAEELVVRPPARTAPAASRGGEGGGKDQVKNEGPKPPTGTAPAASKGGEGEGGREGLDDGLPTRVAMTDQHRPAPEQGEEIPAGTWRGWVGRGRPREVTFMGRTAAFHDGGGICCEKTPVRGPKPERPWLG